MTWLLSPTERFPIYPHLQYRSQGKEKMGIGNPDPGEARMTRKRRTVRCPLPARAARAARQGRQCFTGLLVPVRVLQPRQQGRHVVPRTSGPARCPRSGPRRFPSAHACRSHDGSLQSAKICTNCGIWRHHRACSLWNRSTRQVFRL